MSRLRLYRVDIEYIKYLYKFDKKVQYNKKKEDRYTERRPYIGIVLKIGGFDYFAPLESPKPEHKKLKNNVHIMKINGGKNGLIAFGNMIPIDILQLVNFDINKEEISYRQILNSQFIFCNNSKNKKSIKQHAEDTYNKVVVEKSKFHRKVCCNFKLLEEKCIEYKKNKSTN